MIKVVKTDGSHPDFIELVKHLDAYLTITDGEEHDFYHQYNSIEGLQYVILAYENEEPVSCGTIKEFDTSKCNYQKIPNYGQYKDIENSVCFEKWLH